ncbi:hypothetical protein ACFYVK_31825 [Streptomyces chartreusis]|uniref:hypothetical protein n=1 Tax=Streptomyces chartreusis TaxID=1969 RepID=UPI0036B894DF
MREADGWHVVFRVQTEVVDPTPHTGPTVGIDRSIARPLALSDGTFREHSPWLTSGETKRLRHLEKAAARKRHAGKKGEKTSRRLARVYNQIAQLRAKAKRRTQAPVGRLAAQDHHRHRRDLLSGRSGRPGHHQHGQG